MVMRMIVAAVIVGTSLAGEPGQQHENLPPASSESPIDLDDIMTEGKVDKAKAAALGLNPRDIKVPKLKKRAVPEWPPEVMRSGKELQVTLDCRLETDGLLRGCQVVHSGGPKCDAAVAAAVAKWRFTPLIINGAPRTSIFHVSFTSEVALGIERF
jgi:TonB family protein